MRVNPRGGSFPHSARVSNPSPDGGPCSDELAAIIMALQPQLSVLYV